jgi:hypothetical protein
VSLPRAKRGPQLNPAMLAGYREWCAEIGEEPGLWLYLANTANYDLAAAFSNLFWPDFLRSRAAYSWQKDTQCGAARAPN